MSVSVIIPTYNRAGLLPAAIDSVLSQTYRDSEIIVVDDGSTDDTKAVVERYGTRVKYIFQKNAGVGAARNHAMRYATGDYVAFLDSDDLWLDFKLGLQVAIFEALPDVGFLFTEFCVLQDDGVERHGGSREWLSTPVAWKDFYSETVHWRDVGRPVPGAPADFPIHRGHLYLHFLENALALPTTSIVRRKALTPTTLFAEGVTIYEDWEFFARLAKDHVGAFADVEMAVNRGHSGPERVTRCSGLAKCECYVSLLERVWKSDSAFVAAHRPELVAVESKALLAVAREALLASDRAVASSAIRKWSALGSRTGEREARKLGMLAAAPIGPAVLRMMSKAKTLGRILTGRTLHGSRPVNPAA